MRSKPLLDRMGIGYNLCEQTIPIIQMTVGIEVFEDAVADRGSFRDAFAPIAHAVNVDVVTVGFEPSSDFVGVVAKTIKSGEFFDF